MAENNRHAGQGPVVLDIGGDIGALVITMPAALAGYEVEARSVAGAPLTHVGVLERNCDGSMRHTAVFGELRDGEYEFYVRPAGPVRLTATVRGGEVCTEHWPGC
ncbi:MAG TPA: hypothetical protein VJ851_18675 [Jatrophihabitans sp.]|nr:hypothetical protein [Jatrophihabitans sp.]